MPRARKRPAATADGSGDQPPQKGARASARVASAKVAARGASDPPSWCSECWAPAAAGECSDKGHTLISTSDAQRTAREAFAEAQAALNRCQARLDATLKSGETLILKAEVDGIDDDTDYMEGATLTIKLVVDGGLNEKEKKSIIAAMKSKDEDDDNLECYPEADETSALAAQGVLKTKRIQPVLHKLSQCVVGQTLPRGTILICPQSNTFDVYARAVVVQKSQRNDRILGQVTAGLGDLRTHGKAHEPWHNWDDEIDGNISSTRISAMYFEVPKPAPKASSATATAPGGGRGQI